MGPMTGDVAREHMPVYHVITPGDHYSPRTGSAIPTVVHGLATGAAQAGDADRLPQRVILQEGTFEPRYTSAIAIEYRGRPAPGRRRRIIDAALGTIGVARTGAVTYFQPVADALRDAPAGYVLAHNAPVLPWLLRAQRHRVVLYAHNDLLRSFSRREAGKMLGSVAAIVCVSESLASQLRERLPDHLHDRLRVVVNGVDTVQFTPAVQRGPGPLRVMFMGRAIPEKGADTLLEAAARLSRPDLEFVVVGSHGFDATATLSPFERRLREFADRVPGGVRFQPFVDRQRLPQLLQEADILTIPSRWPDPCPLTVGEGMATGLPVLAAEVGGIPEILGDAGTLFEPGDAAALASAIGRLADDPTLRVAQGKAARERARDRDWAWTWRRLAQVLDSMPATASARAEDAR